MILDVAKVLAEVAEEIQKAKDMSSGGQVVNNFNQQVGFYLSFKFEKLITNGVRCKNNNGIMEIYHPIKADIKH